MSTDGTETQRYWLWVSRSEYYLTSDGPDRASLEPSDHADPWWICNKNTHKGDLVLLYRTSPKKDIAYLIEAESDPYSPDPADLSDENWRFVCNYRVVDKFRDPLPLAVLRSDTVMRDWGPLRRNFQGIVFPIPLNYWERLSELLVARNPESIRSLSIGQRKSFRSPEQADVNLRRQPVAGAAFGDAETNKLVESGAIAFVTDWYRARDWNIASVERDRCGYDLHCTNAKKELHVEVKGLQPGLFTKSASSSPDYS